MKEEKPSESTSDESDNNSANDNETRVIDEAEQSDRDEVNDSGLLCA